VSLCPVRGWSAFTRKTVLLWQETGMIPKFDGNGMKVSSVWELLHGNWREIGGTTRPTAHTCRPLKGLQWWAYLNHAVNLPIRDCYNPHLNRLMPIMKALFTSPADNEQQTHQ